MLATLRWWRPERLPVVAAEVVPLAEAPGAGRVTPVEREQQRRLRLAHVNRRYRT